MSRRVACREPGGCAAPATPGGFRCLAHLRPNNEAEEVERYAVASALYYGRPDAAPFMSDAEFDGLCLWLLGRQAWKRWPWLEREALVAGTGYDLARLPEELRALAAGLPARDRDRWVLTVEELAEFTEAHECFAGGDRPTRRPLLAAEIRAAARILDAAAVPTEDRIYYPPGDPEDGGASPCGR